MDFAKTLHFHLNSPYCSQVLFFHCVLWCHFFVFHFHCPVAMSCKLSVQTNLRVSEKCSKFSRVQKNGEVLVLCGILIHVDPKLKSISWPAHWCLSPTVCTELIKDILHAMLAQSISLEIYIEYLHVTCWQ